MPRRTKTAKAISKPQVAVVRESFDAFDIGYDDYRERFAQNVPQIGSRRPYWQTAIEDRADGRWLPIYETEFELSEIRAKGRNLATLVSMAIGAQSALANYIFGNGFVFKINSVEEDENAELVLDVQAFVDKLIDDNDFITGDRPGLDRELHDRSREDGEALIALYPAPDGESVRMRTIDVSQLTEPRNARDLEDWLYSRGMLGDDVSYWRFGVHTRFDPIMNCEDIDNPLGYHVVYDTLGNNWDYLPAGQVVHVKRNVGRNAKRGVSDYYAIWRMIEREDKLVANIAEGASVQAAIALIRKHVSGSTKDGIIAMVADKATSEVNRPTPTGTRTVKRQKFYPGTVIDSPAGMETTPGPLGTPGHVVFIEVAQLLMRVCGVRWNMPEYMISGDASNANLASTLVAESPAVKAREADQQFYKGAARSIVWKSLKLAFDRGRFSDYNMDWQDFEAAIEVVVEAPEVASRDGLKSAQESEILSKNGILSARTWATQANLKYDDEVAQGAAKAEIPAPAPLDGADSQTDQKPVAESQGGAHTAGRPFVIRR